MKKLNFLLLAALALPFLALSQHVPLVCQGDIPSELLTRSSEKYSAEFASIKEEGYAKRELKARKGFALEANFVLDDLLRSGLVLFNDEVTRYLGEVVQVLTKEDAVLRNRKINVYTVRSEEVNAFASDRGDLFVTLGLLAQLEDEAQLAFILSHELVHTREGHAVELLLTKEGLSRKNAENSVLRETIFDKNMLSHSAYSKELELEADKGGAKLFLQTRYDPSTINTVFDVLKYSYLPFDDLPFDQELLQSPHYRFPSAYHLEKVNAIGGEDDFADDSKSTHPNIGSRRSALRSSLEGVDMTGRQLYIISSERFKQLREKARFELPMLYLQEDRLPEAIYAAYLLLQKHPDEFYLKKCVAKALYIFAKIKNSPDVSLKHKTKQAEGESHRLYHLLDQLNRKEATILALHYALQLQDQHPGDAEMETVVKDLFIELARHITSLDEFISDIPATPNEAAPEAVPSTGQETERSKYDRIREQKAGQDQPGKEDYWRYAFVGRKQDAAFRAAFDAGQVQHKANEERQTYWESREGRAAWKKELARTRRRGHALGIDKVVVVNPYFQRLDSRRKNVNVDYLKSEAGTLNVHRQIEELAAKAGLDATVLNTESLSKSDLGTFNDIRYLNEWFSEQIEHFDLSLTPGYNQSIVNDIAERYGTPYFLWMGVVSVRIPGRFVADTHGYGYTVSGHLRTKYEMLYYAILYDVKTGRRQVLRFSYFQKKDVQGLLRGHFYDTFSQIKKKGKKRDAS